MDNVHTALAGIGGISFWSFFLNSMILAVASVIAVLVSCSFTAYAFARINFPGRGVWFALMIGMALVPVMLIFFVFQRYLIEGVSTQGITG